MYEDTSTDMNIVYDPSHPDADDNGYVIYPNVNPVQENDGFNRCFTFL